MEMDVLLHQEAAIKITSRGHGSLASFHRNAVVPEDPNQLTLARAQRRGGRLFWLAGWRERAALNTSTHTPGCLESDGGRASSGKLRGVVDG